MDNQFQQQLRAALACLEKLQGQVSQLPAAPSSLTKTMAGLAAALTSLQDAPRSGLIDLNHSEIGLAEERNMLRTLIDNLPDYGYFRAILNSLAAHIAVVDRQGFIMVVNEAWEQFARQQGLEDSGRVGVGVNYLAACQNVEAEAARLGIVAVLNGSQPRFALEYPCCTPEKDLWFLMTVTPLSEKQGGAVIAHLDITRRKQIEVALQRERDFAESLIETAPVLTLVLDTGGRIVRYNSYMEEMLGYRLAEVQGQDWFDICFPERARGAIRDLFLRAIKSDIYIHGHVSPVITRQGQTREIEWSGRTLRDADGQIIGLLAIGQDITRRRQIEAEKTQLLEAVTEQREQLRALTGRLAETREIERKELARELHDQVGQKLTALNLNLNIIQTQLPAAPAPGYSPIQRCLTDSLTLVEQTTECIQDLMANLRPPVLDDYGLVAALRWYSSQFARRVNFTITVQGKEPKPRLAGPVEHALFHITQEALTNVAKHAQANHVSIVLTTKVNQVLLAISDDGRGFEAANQAGPTGRRGWGLLTMVERAEAVGGHCWITSQPGQGSRVLVEAPR